MAEPNNKKTEVASHSLELEDIDERQIVAIETTQVNDVHGDFDQEKKSKRKLQHKDFDSALEALTISERACRINVSIYAAMMVFAVALATYSLSYSAFFGIGLYPTIFGVLSIASFVSILLIAPQSKISKNAAKIVQMNTLYSAYVNQLAVLGHRDVYKRGEKSIDEVERTSKLLEQVTFNTVDKLENLIENKPNQIVNKKASV
ncbi:MAG: hypothetical protein ABSA75_01970 [Candidatus Bathyarchaeia archaeon]